MPLVRVVTQFVELVSMDCWDEDMEMKKVTKTKRMTAVDDDDNDDDEDYDGDIDLLTLLSGPFGSSFKSGGGKSSLNTFFTSLFHVTWCVQQSVFFSTFISLFNPSRSCLPFFFFYEHCVRCKCVCVCV